MDIDIIYDWAEAFAFFFVIVGFILSLTAANVVYSYVFVLLMGAVFGRVLFRFKTKSRVPLYLIILGFLLGFLIGNYRADFRVLIVLYVLGIYGTYWLHDKGYLKTVEY